MASLFETIDVDTLVIHAERLGLLVDDAIAFEHDSELDLFRDYCLHACTADQASVLQQYLAEPFEGDALDERIRDSLGSSHFSIYELTEIVIATGVMVHDLFFGDTRFVVDRGLCQMRNGGLLAARLRPMGEYWLTSGFLMPVDSALIGALGRSLGNRIQDAIDARHWPADLQSDVCEVVLSQAIGSGLTALVTLR